MVADQLFSCHVETECSVASPVDRELTLHACRANAFHALPSKWRGDKDMVTFGPLTEAESLKPAALHCQTFENDSELLILPLPTEAGMSRPRIQVIYQYAYGQSSS